MKNPLSLLLEEVSAANFRRVQSRLMSDHMKTLINQTDPETGHSALSIAVSAGHAFIVRLLLEYHADPQWINSGQETLLHLAALQDEPEIMHLLLTAIPISVNALDSKDHTPLQNILFKKEGQEESKTKMAKLLIEYKADSNFRSLDPIPEFYQPILRTKAKRIFRNIRLFDTALHARQLVLDYAYSQKSDSHSPSFPAYER